MAHLVFCSNREIMAHCTQWKNYFFGTIVFVFVFVIDLLNLYRCKQSDWKIKTHHKCTLIVSAFETFHLWKLQFSFIPMNCLYKSKNYSVYVTDFGLSIKFCCKIFYFSFRCNMTRFVDNSSKSIKDSELMFNLRKQCIIVKEFCIFNG